MHFVRKTPQVHLPDLRNFFSDPPLDLSTTRSSAVQNKPNNHAALVLLPVPDRRRFSLSWPVA